MCGIVGILGFGDKDPEWIGAIIRQMSNAISHRGPDGTGVWMDASAEVALGHRRLSIVDLSVAGSQPMVSQSGKYIIVFNGEIYNHLDMRLELNGLANVKWRGNSDTETLLEYINEFGIESTLARCDGMFGLAVWEKSTRSLFLARDRMGEKPIYYSIQKFGKNRVFLFGSELKALTKYPNLNLSISRRSVALYANYNYIPAPNSIYDSVCKLSPGCFIKIDTNITWELPLEKKYWSLKTAAINSFHKPFQGSRSDAVQTLDQLLGNAVGSQMAADVPIGAFLSGGIDSSVIVALMQLRSNQPVNTFTIGFDDSCLDESLLAKEIADSIGTKHINSSLTDNLVLGLMVDLGKVFDEPFADPSSVPTYFVSSLAKQHVTVCLSGDGGDELFAGYKRYTLTYKYWDSILKVPLKLRRLIANVLLSSRLVCLVGLGWLPDSIRNNNILILDETIILKIANILYVEGSNLLYNSFVSNYKDSKEIFVGDCSELFYSDLGESLVTSIVENMMIHDLIGYLPNNILVKLDQCSMSFSLEARVPMLDRRVVEFALSLPIAYKIHDGESKWVLREVLRKNLKCDLSQRSKKGFTPPIGRWLRGPLRGLVSELLNEKRIESDGYFKSKTVGDFWSQCLKGSNRYNMKIWNIFNFNLWLQLNK